MKVLIVDDNKAFREEIRFLLENNKGQIKTIVDEAQNGESAIEYSKNELVDLIIMDIEMPGINGIDAAKQILWHNQRIKILALTMYQDMAYLSELIGAGFKGCIFKNDVTNKLEDAIEYVMNDGFYFTEDIQHKKGYISS